MRSLLLLALLACASAQISVPSKSAGRKLKSNKAPGAAPPAATPATQKKMPNSPQSPIATYFKTLPETTKTSLSSLMKEQRKVKDIPDAAVKNSTRKTILERIKALLGAGFGDYRKARDATTSHKPSSKATPALVDPPPVAATGVPKKISGKKKKKTAAFSSNATDFQTAGFLVVQTPHTTYEAPADATFPMGRTIHVRRADAMNQTDSRFHDCLSRVGGAADVHGGLQTYVTVCPRKASGPAPPVLRPHDPRLIVCLPPLYGRVSRGRLLTFWSHHKALGASVLLLYTTAPIPNTTWLPPPVKQIVVPWSNDGQAWSNSQVWVINDCIQRSASMGYTHALNCDFDEFLVISELLRAQNRSLRSILRADVDVFRAHRYNKSSRGKHITRTASVWTAQVHEMSKLTCFTSADPSRCDKADGSSVAIRHKRLQPKRGPPQEGTFSQLLTFVD